MSPQHSEPLRTSDHVPSGLAMTVAALYVFLLFCRILEFLQVFGLGSLRPMMLVTLIALVVVVLTGNVLLAIRTPLGVLLIAWTAWMIVSIPFSTWRSESLNQLGNTWLKSLMVFFIIAGLGATAASFQRIASSMGWAALASALVVLPGFVMTGFGADPDDRLAGIGSLSNPNEIAFHLWLGMPFLVLLAVRSRTWKKVLLIGVCLFELGLIVKTVSREGLLISLVVITIAMVRVSLSNKVKICVAAFVLMTVAIGTLPQESLSRYLTLFSSDVSGAAAASAQLSSRTRKQKLKESIELTLQHPIFGVGMGVFMPASVELAKSNRDRPEWAMSHNSYTQVSSELGFPGFLILLSIYAAGFVQIWRIDRDARRAGRDDARQICTALFVALVVLSLHFCFDAMAYVFYLPLVMGIIQAFTMAYKGLRVAQTDSVIATENVLSQPKWRTANTVAGGAALDRRNPYRFGRRRSESR